jgi:heat shock protein HslJ/uncharacterized lipoprotein NlpE involved in copper resistance
MKNFILTVGLCSFILGFGMSACKTKNAVKPETNTIATGDNSSISVDWAGTYMGTVPCADCQGILTRITLKEDNTYNLQIEYVGKGSPAENFEGTFQWDDAGNTVTLGGLKERSMPSAYMIGENKLIQLDMEGKEITGGLASKYVLAKIDESFVDKKWKLFELKDVDLSTKKSGPATEVFITFQLNGNRVHGNSGCNNFTGTYQTGPGAVLYLSQMVSTRKMCFDMTVEDQMSKLFQLIDNYSLQADTLSLKQRDTVLARFVRDNS